MGRSKMAKGRFRKVGLFSYRVFMLMMNSMNSSVNIYRISNYRTF